MRPARVALAGVVVASLGCARGAGPKPGESTLWEMVAPGTSADGCDDAAPLVEAVADSFGDGMGIGWSVDAAGETARLLACDEGVDVSLDTCGPSGDPGPVSGDAITWEIASTVLSEGPCALTSVETLTVTDGGNDGTLRAVVTFATEGGARCALTLDGVPVEPDGCAVAVEADLALVEWEKTL